MKRILLGIIFVFLTQLSFAASSEAMIYFYQGEYDKALPGLEKQAKAGSSSAMYSLGLMYLQGYGVKKNIKTGLENIEKAALKGSIVADKFLGVYYLKNKQNPSTAFKWFKKAADKGDLMSIVYIGGAYLKGFGIKENKHLARRYITRAAQKGNPLAQYELAKMFLDSRHKKSRRLGITWLTKAAKGGNQQAQIELAKRYQSGDELGRNPVKVDEWRQKALAQKTFETNLLKAIELEKSEDTHDKLKAITFYEKAIKDGHPDAAFRLAKLYLSPDIELNDSDKVIGLLESAAKSGHKKAKEELVKLYGDGIHVTKDEKKKAYWEASLKKSNNKAPDIAFMYWLARDNKAYSDFSSQQVPGILHNWQNKTAVKDGVINGYPQTTNLKRQVIFNNQLTLISPTNLSRADYFRYLGPVSPITMTEATSFPEYPVKFKHLNADDVRRLYGQARLGNRVAQFQMAQLHQHGIVVEKNEKLALAWYLQAAELNNLKAEYQLGLMYLYGKGTEVDFTKALFWLNRSAFKGNHFSQFALARIYHTGFGHKKTNQYIAKDFDRAKSMYFLAVSGDNPNAKYQLANLLDHQRQDILLSPTKELAKLNYIRKLYEEAANQGVNEAKIPLAYYLAATSHQQDRLEWAASALEKVSADDAAKSAFMLGLLYDRGLGVEQNSQKAVEEYEVAIKDNSPLASFVLGTYYFTGHTVGEDKERAVELLDTSKAKGLPFTYFNLAVIKAKNNKPYLALIAKAKALGSYKANLYMADNAFLTGDTSGYPEAVSTYKKYAEKGFDNSELKLGYIYDYGIGVKKDYQKAYEYYIKAARQGNQYAAYLVARMYQFGKLGKQDIAKALYWYHLAAKKHLPVAYVKIMLLLKNGMKKPQRMIFQKPIIILL